MLVFLGNPSDSDPRKKAAHDWRGCCDRERRGENKTAGTQQSEAKIGGRFQGHNAQDRASSERLWPQLCERKAPRNSMALASLAMPAGAAPKQEETDEKKRMRERDDRR